MRRAFRTFHENDRGTTLMEVFVASVVTTAAMAIGFGVLWSFLRHTHGQMALSQVESESRVVLRDMLIHMREASGPGGTAGPVASLDWDRVVLYADVAPSDGFVDRIEYRLANCAGGFCELQMIVTPPSNPGATVLTYDNDDALPARTLLTGVIAADAEPLFMGLRWNAGASSRVEIDDCAPCTIASVAIDLRVRPMESRVNPGTLRILEEVRLRNA